MTIGTPHLGVDGNTYFPIPRYVEWIIAKVLFQTGSDLFRFSTTIDQLTVNDKFIRPLQGFQHRWSYANAYHTDHVVPLRTAAFLSSNVHSNHFYRPYATITGRYHISLVVETLQQERQIESCRTGSVNNFTSGTCIYNKKSNNNNNNPRVIDNHNSNRLTFDEMSVHLDSLGWTKVLCDMRKALPQIPTSLFSWLITTSGSAAGGGSSQSSSFLGINSRIPNMSVEKTCNKTNSNCGDSYIMKESTYQQPNVFSSSELLQQYGSMSTDRWVVPIGHSMLGAHAHFSLFGYINSGGRPMVEQMSTKLIQQITTSIV
jgi:hypothetical protein